MNYPNPLKHSQFYVCLRYFRRFELDSAVNTAEEQDSILNELMKY